MEIGLSRRCSKPGKLGGWERLVRTLPQVQGVCRDRFHLDTCNVRTKPPIFGNYPAEMEQ